MNFLSNVLREDGGFEYKKVRCSLETVGIEWAHNQIDTGGLHTPRHPSETLSSPLIITLPTLVPPHPHPPQAIVDSILVLIREIPEAKEMGLAQLCEFIEVRVAPLCAGGSTH